MLLSPKNRVSEQKPETAGSDLSCQSQNWRKVGPRAGARGGGHFRALN